MTFLIFVLSSYEILLLIDVTLTDHVTDTILDSVTTYILLTDTRVGIPSAYALRYAVSVHPPASLPYYYYYTRCMGGAPTWRKKSCNKYT